MSLITPSKYKHLRFGCLMAILFLLILIRYAFQIDMPRVFLLIVIGLIAILGDRNEIVAACISFIPLHESIDFYYALVICVVVYIVRHYKDLHIGFSVLLVFIVCVWEALHCLNLSFSVIDYLSYIIPFIVLAVLMATDVDKLEYSFIVRSFALSTLGISLILLIRVFYFADFDITTALIGLERLGSDYHSGIQDVTVVGGQINPNSLGVITVLATTGLMQLRRMGCSNRGDIILSGFLIFFASLSASRTYLVCLALMFLLLVFSEKGGTEKKIKLIALISVATVVIVVAMAVFFPNTFTYFISRFSVDDITTGRSDLITEYHQFIVSEPRNLLFGIGLQDYGNRLTQVYRVADVTPHNFIQEIVIAWGIPGLVVFGILFINMYYESSRNNINQSLINWIPFIIIIVKCMAGQLLTSSYTMLALSFAYLSLCHNFARRQMV